MGAGLESLKQKINDSVDVRELVGMTQDMVRIPSENPGESGEDAVTTYIEGLLKEVQAEGRRYDFAPKRSNVIGSLRGEEPGRRLVFNGHTDTVPIGTRSLWTRDPLGGDLVDGRIYGRGACDMKGGLAAVLEAAYILRRLEIPFKGEFVISAFGDEEAFGRYGSRALQSAGALRGDAAVGCEPSGMIINTCEKGTVWLEIETRGKSIHASKADLGVNASVKMAKVILSAERLRFDVPSHRLLGLPIIASATTIQGGVKTNIVPDRCRATFDIRFPPGIRSDDVVAGFQRMVDGLRAEDSDLDASVQVLFKDEALDVSEDEEIVRVAKDAWRVYYGEEPRISGFLAGTDMKVFAQSKIPCLVALGPGQLEVAHTVDEFVDVKQLEDAAKIYALMALEYLGVSSTAGS